MDRLRFLPKAKRTISPGSRRTALSLVESANVREADASGVEAPKAPSGYSAAWSGSYLLLAPAAIWMTLFLILPLAMIVYVSFWTQTTFKIEPTLTLHSWQTFFASDAYITSLWTTVRIWLIVL